MPIAYLVAGPLIDRIFDPLMMPEGALGPTILGQIWGTGTGRGIGLIFGLTAVFLWIESLVAFANPRIRNVEYEIPDAIPDEITAFETADIPEGAAAVLATE